MQVCDFKIVAYGFDLIILNEKLTCGTSHPIPICIFLFLIPCLHVGTLSREAREQHDPSNCKNEKYNIAYKENIFGINKLHTVFK